MEVYSISDQELGAFAEHCKQYLGFLVGFGFIAQPPGRKVHNRIASCEYWGAEVAIQCEWEKADEDVSLFVVKMDPNGPIRCHHFSETGEVARSPLFGLFPCVFRKERALEFGKTNAQLPQLERQIKYSADQLRDVIEIIASKGADVFVDLGSR
jgi:hypothetical protein